MKASPRLRSIALAAYLFLALAGGTLLIVRGLGRIDTVLPKRPVYDLVVDWRGARAFVEGFSPYSPEGLVRSQLTKTGNGHPPSTLFWALPLTPFELPVARQILFELSLLLLLLELGLIAGELRAPHPWFTGWLALGMVLSCDWMDYLFFIGQVSQLIAFAYFLAWYSLRRGWEVRGGLAVGAACTIKVYPGVLLLLLILGRRWRACLAAAALYLVIAVIMTARFGLASWPQFLAQQSGVANQWMASIQNQSIHGFVLRFFHPTCRPRGPMLPLATAISTVAALGLLAGGAWLARGAARTRDRFDLAFGLAAVLSVFTANWAWEHYNVVFLLPLALVAAALPRMKGWHCHPAWRVLVAALLALAAAALAVPMLAKADAQNAYAARPDPRRHLWLHVLEGVNMVPVMALVAAFFLLVWLSERASRSRTD
jgi:alpha-1,2-mannosyltransferase